VPSLLVLDSIALGTTVELTIMEKGNYNVVRIMSASKLDVTTMWHSKGYYCSGYLSVQQQQVLFPYRYSPIPFPITGTNVGDVVVVRKK
jgi:hypothetical protein